MPNSLLSFWFSSISPFGTLFVAQLNFALNLASCVVFKKPADQIHSMLIPSNSFKNLLFVSELNDDNTSSSKWKLDNKENRSPTSTAKAKAVLTFNWPFNWVHLTPLRLILLDSKLSNLFYIQINELFEIIFSKCRCSFGKVSVKTKRMHGRVFWKLNTPARKKLNLREKTRISRFNLNFKAQI